MADESGAHRGSRRVTMDDVAAEAGVSQMTVSRVMRGKGYISETVRERVARAAARIGYVHNKSARGVAGYDNPLVGVVLPTLRHRVFASVLSGINSVLGQAAMRPLFGVSEYSAEVEEEIVLDLMSWRPRGLILTGLEHSDALRDIIARSGVRIVEVMDLDGAPMGACFGFSHQQAGSEMAQHLIEKGYRTVSLIASDGGRDLRAGKRFEAFQETFRASGGRIIDVLIPPDASSMPLGRRLTAEALAASERPAALYFSNDDLAGGGMMHCLSEGVRVPQDVALCGFNGLSCFDAMPLPLTTSATPRFEIGERAALFIATGASQAGAPPVEDLGVTLRVGETT